MAFMVWVAVHLIQTHRQASKKTYHDKSVLSLKMDYAIRRYSYSTPPLVSTPLLSENEAFCPKLLERTPRVLRL